MWETIECSCCNKQVRIVRRSEDVAYVFRHKMFPNRECPAGGGTMRMQA